jgi:hypothetical protein
LLLLLLLITCILLFSKNGQCRPSALSYISVALRPDGYIGAFFKHGWNIVKLDVVQALREIFALRGECWNLLNSTDVALIAKTDDAQVIGDHRLISITHNMARILGKVLANRLSPHLDKMEYPSKSAFIKG